MPSFSQRELTVIQVMAAIALAAGFIMGITGKYCLSHEVGLPEYISCLKSTGWTVCLLSALWLALSTWRRIAR